MVTHDQVEALAIANKILLLNGGVVEQAGTPQEMYGAPTTLFVAEFMGSNNRLSGTLQGRNGTEAAIQVGGSTLKGLARCGSKPPGSPASAVIRLEAVKLASDLGPNRLGLELSTSMFLGSHWEHVFRGEGVAVRATTSLAVAPGHYWVEFPAESLWVY